MLAKCREKKKREIGNKKQRIGSYVLCLQFGERASLTGASNTAPAKV
jgi:hypothetical protein